MIDLHFSSFLIYALNAYIQLCLHCVPQILLTFSLLLLNFPKAFLKKICIYLKCCLNCRYSIYCSSIDFQFNYVLVWEYISHDFYLLKVCGNVLYDPEYVQNMVITLCELAKKCVLCCCWMMYFINVNQVQFLQCFPVELYTY